MHHLLPRGPILWLQVRTHRLLTILMLIALPSQVSMSVCAFIGIYLMKRRTCLDLLIELADHDVKPLHLKLILWIAKPFVDLDVLGSTDWVIISFHCVCEIFLMLFHCQLTLRCSFWLCLSNIWCRLFWGTWSSLLNLRSLWSTLGPFFRLTNLLLDLKYLILWSPADCSLLRSTVFLRFHLNAPLGPDALLRGLSGFWPTSRFHRNGFCFRLCCSLHPLRLCPSSSLYIIVWIKTAQILIIIPEQVFNAIFSSIS